MNRVSAIIQKQWWSVLRNWERLTDVIFWPLIDIILWGLSVKWLTMSGNGDAQYLSVFLISLIVWRGIWQGCCEVCMNFIEECWSRNLMNLLASPLSYAEWVVSSTTISWIKLIFTFIVSLLIANTIYGLSLSEFGYFGVFSFLLMSFFGQILGLFVTGIIFRSGLKAQSLAWTFPFMISPFVCAFFPVAVLPEPFQYVAKLFPPSWIFEELRARNLGLPINPYWIFYSIILTLLYLIFGVITLIRSFNYLKENGLDHLE